MRMQKGSLGKGIAIMLSSSFLTCTGQLFWKLAAGEQALWFVALGFFCYGCGALLMILALRFGDLSILHPMLSFGYILSIFLGALVLQEVVTATKVLGIAIIILGLVCLSMPERGRK